MEVEQKKREQAAIRSMESAGVVSVPPCINTTRCFTWLFHSTEIGVTVALLLWTVAMLLTVATTAMPQGNNF